ncbi:MAG: hemolysin D [Thermoguttaceae bacterium]
MNLIKCSEYHITHNSHHHMVSLSDSLVSSSARQLPIQVRPDLIATQQYYLGRSYWIVKEPIGLRYFRFHDEEYALLKLFDGHRSLDEIKTEFERQFPPQKIRLEELQHFLGQLHQSGLLLAGVPDQGPELLKRKKKRFKQEMFQKLTNVLAIKFKGFDPDGILTALLPSVRFLFSPVVVIFCLLLCLCALCLVLVEFDTFRSRLPAFNTFFGTSNIFLLAIVLAFTKVFHEFGHGLTAKYFKGECHEMGVMILVLTPCLYVNVSDSWLLPNKWHRMMIALAGIYVECVLAAIATFIWWFSTPGITHYLALNVMFIASVSTIVFNMNPLLRYDGYYVLSDWLEIPNLRQKATKILTQKCSEWFLGMEHQEDPFLPQKNQLWFAFYSIAAFCYRWVVMASILYFVYKVFEPYGLQVIGQGIAIFSLFSLFIMPIYKVAKFFWVPGRIYQVKPFRFYLSASLVAAILGAVLFVPLPYFVLAPAIIELRPATSEQIYIPDIKGGARLVRLDVKPNQIVNEGDALGLLESDALLSELIEQDSKYRDLIKELETLEELQMYKNEAALKMGPVREMLTATESILRQKHHQYENLTLKSPISGVVVSPPWKPYQRPEKEALPFWSGSPLEPSNIGATLEPGTLFCSIGDPTDLEAVLVVNQSQREFLHLGQKVELKLTEFPETVFIGEIQDMEGQALSSLEPQLSTRVGGDVPTTTQRDGSERPNSPSFRVRMPLDNSDLSVFVGMTGTAKVQVASQTLGMRLFRFCNETFNFKL